MPAETISRAAAMELHGAFDITFVASDGDSAGASRTGRLELIANDSTRLRRRGVDGRVVPHNYYPAYGTLTPNVLDVGLAVEGAVSSADPVKPGVRVWVWQDTEESSQVQLRLELGDRQNDPQIVLLDGAYTDVNITRLTSAAFYGVWTASVGMTNWRAGGHFCARRIGPDGA